MSPPARFLQAYAHIIQELLLPRAKSRRWNSAFSGRNVTRDGVSLIPCPDYSNQVSHSHDSYQISLLEKADCNLVHRKAQCVQTVSASAWFNRGSSCTLCIFWISISWYKTGSLTTHSISTTQNILNSAWTQSDGHNSCCEALIYNFFWIIAPIAFQIFSL